jgi:hypothetical protein
MEYKAYIYNSKFVLNNNYDFSKEECLFKIKDPAIYRIIQYKNNYYVISWIQPKKLLIGIEKLNLNLLGKTKQYETNIVCPYCGYVDCDSWEKSDDSEDNECGCCGLKFSYERNVTVEYSSFPIEQKIEIKIIDIEK